MPYIEYANLHEVKIQKRISLQYAIGYSKIIKLEKIQMILRVSKKSHKLQPFRKKIVFKRKQYYETYQSFNGFLFDFNPRDYKNPKYPYL